MWPGRDHQRHELRGALPLDQHTLAASVGVDHDDAVAPRDGSTRMKANRWPSGDHPIGL
jgi:hypothetical protein